MMSVAPPAGTCVRRPLSLLIVGVFSAFFLVAAASGASASDTGGLRVLGSGTPADPPSIRVLSQNANGVELGFELPSVVIEDMPADGEVFHMLAIPRGGENGEIGQPMLPVFGRLVQIPDRAGVRITTTIEESEEHEGIRVLPVQAEEGPFAMDVAAYSRSGYSGAPVAVVGSPALIRGIRVVPLTFSPVDFDPAAGKIRLARRVHVSVSFTGESLENAGRQERRSITPSFDRLCRELVVNYDRGERDVQAGMWLLIAPNNGTVVTDLQPLVTWRQRKGLPALLVTTQTTGTSATAIKNYIQNAYNTWDPAPEYIVLAGDATGSYSIPTWYENLSGNSGEGDHPYTQLDGTDPLSDAHIGRLSFGTLTELEVIVNKITNYESNPFTTSDPDWFSRSCLTGDPAHSEWSAVQVMQWAKERLRNLGYTQIDTVFSGSFVPQMQTALNRGDFLFAYRGYLNMSGWGSSNVNAMTNGWKMPFCAISTCGTGSFAYETSISETFLRAGTLTTPRGGIAATGTATWATHTRFNNCYVYGMLGAMLFEDEYTLGAVHTRGKYELYLNYWNSPQSSDVIIFSYWNNLMGDPATECWTGYPATMTVNAPASLAVGANSAVITVQELSNPVPGADVCLWKGTETYVVGKTDAAGVCEVPVNFLSAGTALLTVSKHNHRSHQASIPVNIPSVYVGYQSSTVGDDANPPSAGNGDGLVNPGETVELPVQVHNFGTQSAPGVTAALTSADPYVTLTAGTATVGDMAGSASAWTVTPFVFSVDPGCPNGHVLRFSLDVTSGGDTWHSLVELPVRSAELTLKEFHWYGAGGNGLLDPGETAELSIGLNNVGPVNAVTPAASLISLSDYVVTTVSQADYPTINAGGTGENTTEHFKVQASSACYNGYLAPMKLVLEFSGGVRDTVLVSLPVGTRASTDPTGPDAYGYLAYDNTDAAYPEHPTYSWVEIDPAYGGNGTEIVLGDNGNDQDKSRSLDLPFPFSYYGASYTRATVCSNGWVVMGNSYLQDYRNWTLPSVGGPNGVIAVFWDDLYQYSGAKAYQKYDSANHRWIVEWSRFRNLVSSGTVETFEAIFYDPAYWPTDTGDGIIEFQYQETHNIDSTDGYCTVGIEKPDNTDAVLYTYFNLYTPGSATLGTTGRAIRFVPHRTDITAAPHAGSVARGLAFSQATGNPLRAGGSILFSTSDAGPAKLALYNVQGQVVRSLFQGRLPAGDHSVSWDGRDDTGRDLSSGVYFLSLQSGQREVTRKAMVVR